MFMSNRRYEQGGVVSFVVVATVLALLLAAGIWFAKQQVKSAQESGATTTQVAKSDSTSNSQATQPEESTQPATQSTNNDTSTAESQSPTATTPSVANSNEQATSSTATTTPNVASSGPSQPDLPSTGLGDVILTVLSVGALGVGFYVYIGSHKRLRTSALK